MSEQGSRQQDILIQDRNSQNDAFSQDNNTIQTPLNLHNDKGLFEQNDINKRNDVDQNSKVDQLGDVRDITKSVIVNKKMYTYVGKPHPEIMQLFELLERKQEQTSYFRIVNYMRQKVNQIEEYCDKHWVFFGGRMKISIYEFIVYLFFLTIYVVYAVEMASLSNNITIERTEWKVELVSNQIWFGALFVVYGIMQTFIRQYSRTQYINIKSLLILFLLFISLVVVQIILLLNDLNILTNGVSNIKMPAISTIYARAYPIVLYIHWFIFSAIYNWLKTSFSRSSSMFFGIGWCLLLPYFVCLNVLSYILLQSDFQTFSIINNILSLLLAPFIIVVVFSWVLLHFRLFMLPVSNIAIAIARIKEELNKKFKQPIPVEDEDDDLEDPQKKKMRSSWQRFKKWFRLNLYIISSIILGTVYIFCEIFLIYQVLDQFNSSSINYDNIAILIFQIIVIPAFVILGIIISVSKRQTWATFTFFPLFVAALPLFGIIPVSYLLDETSFGGNLIYAAIIALPTIVIYWLILGLFGVQKRYVYLVFISYTCIFFAFPIGFLLPLSYVSINGIDATTIYIIAGSIVATGVGILLLIALYYIIKLFYVAFIKKEKKSIIDLTALSFYNLKNMGFLVNSSGFILGYTLLCYVFYSRPSTSSNDDRGFVDAMLVNLPTMFLLINYSLQQESLEYITEDDSLSIDISMSQSNISKSQISQMNEFQEVTQKLKFQQRIIYAGIIIPFVVCIPIYILSSNRQNTTRTLVVMLGFPFAFIILKFLLDVKNKSKKFQNFFTPFLVTVCWCCVIFPLFVITPFIANYVATDGPYFAEFMRGVVASVAIILICGVTSFSIFIFIIKNQLEQEKKKKFVVTQMMKTCFENRVKATANPLAVLYDYFERIQEQEEKMKKSLQKDKKPLKYRKLTTNKNFEQEVVISKEDKIKKIEEQKEKQKSKWDYCLDLLFCRYGIVVDDLNKESDSDGILTVDDISRQERKAEEIMDDYLPSQMKQGYLFNYQDQMNDKEEQVNLMQYVEQTKEQRAIDLYEDKKHKVKSKHDQFSSKTPNFRSIKLQKIKASDMNKFRYTDYASLIYNSEFERGVFFHDLYKDFANEDDNQPESLIYSDFLELCRLSGILQVDEDYASSIQSLIPSLREKQDSIPSDLQSFEDLDFDTLTQKELSQIYDAHASMFWKGGILALSISDFSKCMLDMAIKLSVKKESSTDTLKLRELLYERMFPYLMINIPNFASNYRPDVRKFMKKDEIEERMEGSPFVFTQVPKLNTDKDEEKVFDYTKKRGYLLNMEKEHNMDYKAFQMDYSQAAKGGGTPGNRLKNDDIKIQDVSAPKKPKENVSCFIMMCRCLRTCCCVIPGAALTYIDKKINSIIARMTKPKIDNKLMQRKAVVKRAPNWEDMADNLVSSMVIAIKAYEENQKQAQNVHFNWNINNIMTLVGKISDFLTLYGVAFNNSVEWFPGYSTSVDTGKVTSGGIFSNFVFLFWVCFGLGIAYFFIAIIAYGYAEKGTLGKDENGDNANFKHRQFYLSKGVNLLGATLFMMIMKTSIDTYICNWDTVQPWYLYRTSEVVCLSNTHFLMMGLGFISLLAYYPLSTFIQPGIQFLDNTLDVKYDKSYVAVYIQAKLIVLGATSFFNSFSNKTLISVVQLSVTSFIGFGLAVLAIKIQPCLISLINPIEIGFLLAIGIINGTGLIIVLTNESLIGFILNIVLHLIVIIAVITVVRKRLSLNVRAPKKIVLNHLPVIKKTAEKKKDIEQLKATALALPASNLNGINSSNSSPINSKRGKQLKSQEPSQSLMLRTIQKNLKQVDEQSDVNSKLTEHVLM